MKNLIILFAIATGLACARQTVAPINYNQAAIAFLSRVIPMTPGFAPRLDIYTTDDDLKAVGYKVTVISGSSVVAVRVIEAVVLKGYDGEAHAYGFATIPGEFSGPISVQVETLYGSGDVVSTAVPQ